MVFLSLVTTVTLYRNIIDVKILSKETYGDPNNFLSRRMGEPAAPVNLEIRKANEYCNFLQR